MTKQILASSKIQGEYHKLIERINYNNIQAYVERNMPEKGKFFLSRLYEDGTTLKWYVEGYSDYRPLNKANEADKNDVYDVLKELKDATDEVIKKNPELASYVDKILFIPDESCIYFVKDSNGNYKISLVRWGYAPIAKRVENNVITALLNKRKPKSDTVLHIKYATGESVGSRSVYIFKDGVRELKLDNSGSCNLLYLPEGTNLQVALDPEMQKDVQNLTVIEGQTDYTLVFPFYTDAEVKVVDQFDDVCTGKEVLINGEVYQTDENGLVNIRFIKLLGDDELKFSLSEGDSSEATFKLNKDSVANHFVYQIKEGYECNLRVQVLYEGTNKPVGDYPIQVETESNQKYITDQQGYIDLANREVGEQIRVVDWENPDNNSTITLEKGNNDVVLYVPVPFEEQVRIGIIDHKKQPVKGARLEVYPTGKKGEVLQQETDVNGFCSFPKASFVPTKKVCCNLLAKDVNGCKKEKNYKKKFKYIDSESQYILRIKKRSWYWLWLLLLLLLIPLFFNFKKNITVQTVLNDVVACSPSEVDFKYTSRYLYKDGKFFVNEVYDNTLQTDSEGKATFEDVGYSGYSFVFYMLSKVTVQATADCFIQKDKAVNSIFHFLTSSEIIKIPMKEELVNVSVKVVDAELETPVVDAKVNFKFKRNGKITSGSSSTDPNGEIKITQVPKCGAIDIVKVEKYGYKANQKEDLNVRNILGDIPNISFYLTPIKKRITFFVKNKFTKEPLPDAKVTIRMRDPRSGKKTEETVKTDLDGRGVGFYDNLFLLAKVKLSAECEHFKKGNLMGDFTIEEFIKLPDSLRTIYLEPVPYVVNFRNIDSLSLVPIYGVKNIISVNSQDGNNYKDEQTSNRNGVFYVKAKKGDEIIIKSVGDPFFFDKHTQIIFEDEQDIKMKQKEVNLNFRTIDEYDQSLLSNCNLDITVNASSLTVPNDSGNGKFTLHLKASEKLTIKSTHSGYLDNDYQIKNKNALALSQEQKEQRDIIMKLKPCEGGGIAQDDVKIEKGKFSLVEYDMKKKLGDFIFDYNTNLEPDLIEVFDSRKDDISSSNIIFSYNRATGYSTESVKLHFTNRIITVKVTSNSSVWNYKVNCSD